MKAILASLVILLFAGSILVLHQRNKNMGPTIAPIAPTDSLPDWRVPWGLVSGAESATKIAVAAANEVALRDHKVQPFSEANSPATFDGFRWSWRKRVGCGRADLEAEVTFGVSGAVENVTVRYLVQQLGIGF